MLYMIAVTTFFNMDVPFSASKENSHNFPLVISRLKCELAI
jgi:hypothetical protein